MQFSVTFEAEHLVRALAQARVKLEGDELPTSIGLALLKKNNERHAAGQAPDGSPWKPLKPATIARKTDPRMLVETGDMLLKFYSRVDGKSVVVGTADWKAYWHHAGTRHLPARPLVGFPDSDKRLVDLIVEDYLQVILSRLR